MRRGPLHVPLLLLVILLGACASRTGPAGTPPATGPASSTPADPATLSGPVTVQRSGGIAGLRDTVVVDPGGSWRRTSAGRTGSGTGRLTAGQLARLAALAADPRLRAEAGRTAVPDSCADAFSYGVEAGGSTVRYVDCGPGQRPPAADAIVRLVLPATER